MVLKCLNYTKEKMGERNMKLEEFLESQNESVLFQDLNKLRNDLEKSQSSKRLKEEKQDLDGTVEFGVETIMKKVSKFGQELKQWEQSLSSNIKERDRLKKCSGYIKRFEMLKKEYTRIDEKKTFDSDVYRLAARKALLKKSMINLKEKLADNAILDKKDYYRQIEDYKDNQSKLNQRMSIFNHKLDEMQQDVKKVRQGLKLKIRELTDIVSIGGSREDVYGFKWVVHKNPDKETVKNKVLAYRTQLGVLDKNFEHIQSFKGKINVISNGIDKKIGNKGIGLSI